MRTFDDERALLRAIRSNDPDVLSTFTGPLQKEGPMPALTDEIKVFIVKALACFDTPSQVADAVKVTFGIEVSRQQVYVYDPENPQPPAQRWRDLFAATRKAFLRDCAEIGIAHRAVRLRMLDRLATRCERNSVALSMACLEQAARECGGMYENRRPVLVQVALPEPATPLPPPTSAAAMIEATPLRQLPDPVEITDC